MKATWRLGLLAACGALAIGGPMRPDKARLLGWAWLAHALALGLHVADEAAHDFLAFYNPIARAAQARLGLPFPPAFTFPVWLGGLVLGVAALLACTPLAFARRRWIAWIGVVLGLMMVANGGSHIVGSMVMHRWLPGTWSAPVLVVCAVVLVYASATVVRRGHGEAPEPAPDGLRETV